MQELVENKLLSNASITPDDLGKILSEVHAYSVDYSDIYFEFVEAESICLEEQIVKEGGYHAQKGFGIRAVCGDKTGYAHSNEISLKNLLEGARAVRTIAHQNQSNIVNLGDVSTKKQANQKLYSNDNPLNTLPIAEKIEILKLMDAKARKADPRVSQVIVSLANEYEMVLVYTSDGIFTWDIRPSAYLNINVLVDDGKGNKKEGSCGGGGRFGLDVFLKKEEHLFFAEEAVRLALVKMRAKPAPAGVMPVVLGPGWPAVILHEAVGHGLESDFNRKKTSVYSELIGQKVATEHCTIVDDGTLPNRRGSIQCDDEGTPSQRTVLIENGILKNYMQDKLNARLMGMKLTGNARRESFAYPPVPRMTNTFMMPGSAHPEEIIQSVDRGIYAVNFSGGQVDITSGKFVFTTSEAYLIEKGKVTYPIKEATLIGDGPTVLKQISMVGNDMQLDRGIGVCGKDGQSVSVSVGQPTIKVDAMTIGGTKDDENVGG